ncbi:cellulose binding domain-containing protein [Streptomyces sp. NPDC004726]
MGRTTHRRWASGRTKAVCAIAAASAVAGGVALTLSGTAQAASVGATYTRTAAWAGGYSGQYVITNDTGETESDWTLEFDLPAGTTIESLWNGEHTVDGRHVTVKPADENRRLAPGASVTIGFATASPTTATEDDPSSCLINKVACSAGPDPAPDSTGLPTEPPTPDLAPTPTRTQSPDGTTASPPSPTKTASPAQTPTAVPPSASTARYAPFVDVSQYPAYDMLDTAAKTGVKNFNLAFVRAGRDCVPLWGGRIELGKNGVAAQISALRAKGGDVRVSFGGGRGSELALRCTTVDALTKAYRKVIDAYGLTRIDFDVEGKGLLNKAANTRRAQAIARLQQSLPGLDVSFTLPVKPWGLPREGLELLDEARQNGVRVSTVNIMAMDYGDTYTDDMGQYAIRAATATQEQLKGLYGLSDAAAWERLAVTPMIGVNDVVSEVFTVKNAEELVAFARTKKIGWLSMWSATRDKRCSPEQQSVTPNASCSSINQQPLAFTKAFAAYD